MTSPHEGREATVRQILRALCANIAEKSRTSMRFEEYVAYENSKLNETFDAIAALFAETGDAIGTGLVALPSKGQVSAFIREAVIGGRFDHFVSGDVRRFCEALGVDLRTESGE